MTLAHAILGVALAAAVVAVPDPPSITTFSPSSHGFAFVNSFQGSPLPGALGGLGSMVGAPSTFGLCGGMSFAAADFFLARRTIPKTSAIPTRGQPLYDYIYQRQTDSLGPDIVLAAQFSRWMHLPDCGISSAGRSTLGELPAMFNQLDRGEPVVLGLVLTDTAKTRVPWHNHQVLAHSATLTPESSAGILTCALHIYDPNYPGADGAQIEILLAVDGLSRIGHDLVPVLGSRCRRMVPEQRTTRVRGVFTMPYEARVPPANLR